ncbi:TPA: serine/threonine protein phosphatase [Candidatus Bathyarchaeota archaeon]|nr:serine/threonine protein phosphatase [Candidatus Bathyarchaeota archaeon]
MKRLSDLSEEAKQASSEDFLPVIDEADQLISDELKGLSSIRITGRLVHLPPKGKAIIVGDLHGDLKSLGHILNESRFIEKASNKEEIHIIFLGDYGDRGFRSPEVYYIVLNLKILFPEKVMLLQGNHEGPADLLAYPHDLPYHLQIKFREEWRRIYKALSNLFRKFHTAVIVDRKFLMLHGGVPSKARGIDDLAYAYQKHPSESHLEEILWSDPRERIKGIFPSPRGAGRLFGEDVTSAFLNLLGVKFLIRGHEPAMDGYMIRHGGKILTLFSRKGSPYRNLHGAYLAFDLSRDFDSAWQLERFIRKF